MSPVYSKVTMGEHYTNFRKHNMILGGQPVGWSLEGTGNKENEGG